MNVKPPPYMTNPDEEVNERGIPCNCMGCKRFDGEACSILATLQVGCKIRLLDIAAYNKVRRVDPSRLEDLIAITRMA